MRVIPHESSSLSLGTRIGTMAKRLLTIPLIQQEPHSLNCGIASLAMMYAYYGEKISYDELKPEFSLAPIGTYIPQLALNALKRGLHTTIQLANPRLLPKAVWGGSDQALLTWLSTMPRNELSESDVLAHGFFVRYLEEGGHLDASIPTIAKIRESIDDKRPVMAMITSAPLYTNPEFSAFKDTFHMVVVSGYDDTSIAITDPVWGPLGGVHWYSQEDFFFALFSSSLGDFDNGSLLFLSK